MKGVLKIRNLDSLKKLSYKRATGRLEYINYNIHKTNQTIVLLDMLNLLTDDLLWELLEFLKVCYIETRKLNYVRHVRRFNSYFNQEDMDLYVNMLVNVSRASGRLPYQIKHKYLNTVIDYEKKSRENS